MLSLQLIRDNTELVRQSLAGRQDATVLANLDEILRLDQEWRRMLSEVETMRAKRNQVSKKIGTMGKTPVPIMDNYGNPLPDSALTPAQRESKELWQKRDELVQDMRTTGDGIKALEEKINANQQKLNDILLRIPNLVHPKVPQGKDENDNIIASTWGAIPEFNFTPLPHWELGTRLGIIDFDRGVKISGPRFYILKGLGARLQRALIAYMLDLHIREHGYTEIYPPYMVKRECMIGSGNLPKFADNLYHDAEEDFWFVPTAEVPLTNLHRDEIIDPGALPFYYVAFTACFRREKMSAGKDVRGIKRGHQFDKVEMYKFVAPQTSDEELEKMRANAEDICRGLKLPYRIKQLCSADIGFAATMSYDVEMWAPGCGEWLEVSSCSNCGDFQARRANVRYRPEAGAKPQFVHTLNGSGLALPRVVIAVLENNQQADGSVIVPEALRPFMGVDVIE